MDTRIDQVYAEQEDIRSRCFHPGGAFSEFPNEALDASLVSRFAQIVRQYPDRVAVKSHKYFFTYVSLDQKSNQIARIILTAGGGDGQPVGIYVKHDCGMIAAILGVLKSGSFYVPLDPNDPPYRNQSLFEESGARIILADNSTSHVLEALRRDQCTIINIDELDSPSPGGEDLELATSPDALVYILYTSGSTGKPKAVMQTHRNLLQQTLVYTNTLHIAPDDRMSLLHSCSKGASTPHLFSSLLNGASLYPFDVKEQGISRLIDFVRAENLTIYHSIPAVFRNLMHSRKDSGSLGSLRVVHLSGDRATPNDVELYKQNFRSNCIFVHRLGSSEANTVFLYLIDANYLAEGENLPVGHPIQGKEILLVGDQGVPVADGEIGEIVIKSQYLSPGYWRDPQRTHAVFESHPDGTRMFRTGDMGRHRGDGTIEHLGRKDAQVKIRGYRIEIGEVESAILNYGHLTEVAVVPRDNDRGDKELVAYLVSAVKPDPSIAELRQFLGSILPSYMVPTAFFFLDTIPTLPNGKIDRQALRGAAFGRTLANAFVWARTPVERILTDIWLDALNVSQVGVKDNFFELGGHSLSGTKILAGIEARFDIRFEPRVLFDNPTIETLALLVTEALAQKANFADPLF
jgi:amino acid adenylation domain-containing protein